MVNELWYKSTTDHGRCSRIVVAMDLWVPVGDGVITDLGLDVRTDTEEIKEEKMKILCSESFLYFRIDGFP
jgi:hypothetical protein